MWIYEEINKLLYFVSDNFSYQSNVAIFSLSCTLVQDVIHKDQISNMQLNGGVLTCLNHINENLSRPNGSIVIIESGYKISRENIKLITKKFFDLIDNEVNRIPFIIMFPMKNNRLQKPYTHIFTRLEQLYNAKESIIIKEKSIVVGSAAGRFNTGILPADVNDHDRAFASNIEVSFKTSSQFFNDNAAPRQWNWCNNMIKRYLMIKKFYLSRHLAIYLATFRARTSYL